MGIRKICPGAMLAVLKDAVDANPDCDGIADLEIVRVDDPDCANWSAAYSIEGDDTAAERAIAGICGNLAILFEVAWPAH